jgi:hypothetical protein
MTNDQSPITEFFTFVQYTLISDHPVGLLSKKASDAPSVEEGGREYRTLMHLSNPPDLSQSGFFIFVTSSRHQP